MATENTYPAWQAKIREAQAAAKAERKRAEEERQRKLEAEKHRRKAEKKTHMLAIMQLLGIDAEPNDDGDVVLDGIRFYNAYVAFKSLPSEPRKPEWEAAATAARRTNRSASDTDIQNVYDEMNAAYLVRYTNWKSDVDEKTSRPLPERLTHVRFDVSVDDIDDVIARKQKLAYYYPYSITTTISFADFTPDNHSNLMVSVAHVIDTVTSNCDELIAMMDAYEDYEEAQAEEEAKRKAEEEVERKAEEEVERSVVGDPVFAELPQPTSEQRLFNLFSDLIRNEITSQLADRYDDTEVPY